MESIEIWKDIPDYEEKYQVSNTGFVKSLARTKVAKNNGLSIVKEKILKFRKDRGGYLRVALYKDSKQKEFSVSRLVALMFVDNPDNKPEVNHIDEDKTNNNDWNLEWSTRLENIRHGTGVQRSAKSRIGNNNYWKGKLKKQNL